MGVWEYGSMGVRGYGKVRTPYRDAGISGMIPATSNNKLQTPNFKLSDPAIGRTHGRL